MLFSKPECNVHTMQDAISLFNKNVKKKSKNVTYLYENIKESFFPPTFYSLKSFEEI